MGALPLAPDEAFSALQANQPERLPTNGLAAPSHARVVIVHLSNGFARPNMSHHFSLPLPSRFLALAARSCTPHRARRCSMPEYPSTLTSQSAAT